MTEKEKLEEVLRMLASSGWKTFSAAARETFLRVLSSKGLAVASDAANIMMASPVWGPAINQQINKTKTKSWERSVFGPVINTLSRQGVIERNGVTSRGRSHEGMTSEWKLTDQAKEKMKMASKKTTKKEENPRAWHEKAIGVFAEQVEQGKGLEGLTFSEVRKTMNVGKDDAGFSEIATAVTELRDEGFLAHKFSHPSLKEDFYEGDPTEIPNIQKRENDLKIRQLVFFLSPAALSLGDELAAAVTAGEFPEGHEYETSSTVFDRESIRTWFNDLGEIFDLHVEDDEQKMAAMKLIAALMPVELKDE